MDSVTLIIEGQGGVGIPWRLDILSGRDSDSRRPQMKDLTSVMTFPV